MLDPWELPGGLLEIEEDVEGGLKREIREESGLEVAVGQIITIADHWEHNFKFRDRRALDIRIITLIYLCEKMGGEVRLNHEHVEFKWVTLAELADLPFLHSSERAIRVYLARRWPLWGFVLARLPDACLSIPRQRATCAFPKRNGT